MFADAHLGRKTYCFNSLISAIAKIGNIDHTEACLKNMRELGVESDALSYNAIIDGYAHNGDVDGAESTLAKL